MANTSSVTVRLSHGNFMLWRAQMFTHLRSHSLLGHIDSSLIVPAKTITTTTGDGDARRTTEVVNPDYATWYVHDQTVLDYILSTVTEDIWLTS
jgi:hypothetical protein